MILHHNALYKGFSELGRVQRTLFLLTSMIDPALQQHLRTATTTVEASHHCTDGLACGSPIWRSGDPVEQEQRLTYRDVVANAVMLHNVVDMTKVRAAVQQEGVEVPPEVATCLSPYLTEHLKRCGQYRLDITVQPEPPPTALCDDTVRPLWHLFTRILNIPHLCRRGIFHPGPRADHSLAPTQSHGGASRRGAGAKCRPAAPPARRTA